MAEILWKLPCSCQHCSSSGPIPKVGDMVCHRHGIVKHIKLGEFNCDDLSTATKKTNPIDVIDCIVEVGILTGHEEYFNH